MRPEKLKKLLGRSAVNVLREGRDCRKLNKRAKGMFTRLINTLDDATFVNAIEGLEYPLTVEELMSAFTCVSAELVTTVSYVGWGSVRLMESVIEQAYNEALKAGIQANSEMYELPDAVTDKIDREHAVGASIHGGVPVPGVLPPSNLTPEEREKALKSAESLGQLKPPPIQEIPHPATAKNVVNGDIPIKKPISVIYATPSCEMFSANKGSKAFKEAFGELKTRTIHFEGGFVHVSISGTRVSVTVKEDNGIRTEVSLPVPKV